MEANAIQIKGNSNRASIIAKPLEINPTKGLLTGSDDWELMRCNYSIVDKSYLLQKWLEMQLVTIITRPKGWGKSINMAMIKSFFQCPFNERDGSINQGLRCFRRGLFIGDEANEKYLRDLKDKQQYNKLRQNVMNASNGKLDLKTLKIASNETFCNKYFGNFIVIHMNFEVRGVPITSYEQFLIKILEKIKKLYQQHPYLRQKEQYINRYKQQLDHIQKDLELLRNGQNIFDDLFSYMDWLLTQLYHYHGKIIIVLIDSYDDPYNSIKQSSQQISPKTAVTIATFITYFIIKFVKGLHKFDIFRVICTGVRSIARLSQGSTYACPLETIDQPSWTHDCFGFTKEEVQGQLIKTMFKGKQKEIMANVQMMYSGYEMRDKYTKKSITIYNPHSVTLYLKHCFEKREYLIKMNGQNIYKICYWTPQAPEKILKYYLKLINDKCKQFLLNLFLSLHKENKKIEYQTDRAVRYRRNNHQQLQKNYSEYNIQEIIYYLITTGYLTQVNGCLKIPNQQIAIFFRQYTLEYIKDIFQKQIANMNMQERDALNVSEWSTCGDILSNTLTRLLESCQENCEALMSEIMLKDFIILLSTQYTALQQKKIQNIHPSIILVPVEQSNPIVIHEHKILLKGDRLVNKTLQQAVFQIFAKNYLQVPIEKYKKKWETLTMRGVVGYYDQNQDFQLDCLQQTYEKKDALVFSQFSQILFRHQSKDVKSLKKAITPYFPHLSDKTTFEFLNFIKSNYQEEIYQKNKNFMKNFDSAWLRQRQLRKDKESRRVAPQDQFSIQANFDKEHFKNCLILLYFGFSLIPAEEIAEERMEGSTRQRLCTCLQMSKKTNQEVVYNNYWSYIAELFQQAIELTKGQQLMEVVRRQQQ